MNGRPVYFLFKGNVSQERAFMNRKIIILLILAGFPIYSCKVTGYQATNQRNHITKPVLKPPKKGAGQSRCLVTMNEQSPVLFLDCKKELRSLTSL
jgi:hypothetical protein